MSLLKDVNEVSELRDDDVGVQQKENSSHVVLKSISYPPLWTVKEF